MESTPVSPKEMVHSWNQCHGAFYQVSENDLSWNLTEQKLLQYSIGDANGIPVLLAEASSAGKDAGIFPHGLWVSLYGQVKEGHEASFVDGIEEIARQKNKTRVAIGSEEFHFLPGVPVDEPAGRLMTEVLVKKGFSAADCADYVGSPLGGECVSYCEGALQIARERDWTLGLVEEEQDKAALASFLEQEFPGRWRREWLFWGSRSDTKRAFWNLLRDEKGRVIGFSRLAKRGRIQPLQVGWNPGALRLPLTAKSEEDDTDSCLGPIGISKSERGRGAGKVLLGLSLRELVLQGAKRTCIDWTNAYNYYTPLGFEVVRRYLSVWKEI